MKMVYTSARSGALLLDELELIPQRLDLDLHMFSRVIGNRYSTLDVVSPMLHMAKVRPSALLSQAADCSSSRRHVILEDLQFRRNTSQPRPKWFVRGDDVFVLSQLQ